jgi:hypothetical protein
MESFFRTLKGECVDRTRFATRLEARQTIFAYVECFYNRIRRHSTLASVSPMAFEQQRCSFFSLFPPQKSCKPNLSALTPEEEERLEMAIAQLNQAYVDAHHEDRLEMLVADYLAARQDTLGLLHWFTDDQLAALVPTVVGDGVPGDLFAGRAGHAAEHMTSIEEGFRQGR